MKFGFFSPYLNTFGGGERYMLTLASHLSNGHQVDIFWNEPELKAPIARFLKIDLSKTKFVDNIFKHKFLKKSFESMGYNMIFVLSDGSVPSTFAAKNILHFQVPFKFPPANVKTRLKLRKYKYVVCNSKFTKSYIDKSFSIKSRVIYPPVDIDSIKPGNKEKLIISVGRFSPHQLHPKKQEVLIEVFKEVYKKFPQWRLVLAGQAKKGDEKYLRNLKKSVRGFGIKIEDNMKVEDLRNLYGKASIYWHATGFGEDEVKNPERMEHFGISTVEAQAGGAVPVVIGKGGQKEIVEDRKTGRLWTTKSELYDATIDLIKGDEEREKLSKAAIKNSKRFSHQVFFNEYEKIIF
ncbi:MAG: glycosyltransferase family 4 protein [Candidatus Curtissbacteria bacterium]|nr:glycosyltransferase family 4 protein [Candidatus Curtissbacteria bacterium]